jgi:hypothetical protein
MVCFCAGIIGRLPRGRAEHSPCRAESPRNAGVWLSRACPGTSRAVPGQSGTAGARRPTSAVDFDFDIDPDVDPDLDPDFDFERVPRVAPLTWIIDRTLSLFVSCVPVEKGRF